ncbi:hypothetical protein BH23CHL2_BH23CHL2_11020 [soil metagenome]
MREVAHQELAERWPDSSLERVAFLAAGEYTLNYRATIDRRDVVLRIVTGSQMGLDSPEQAVYEAHALEILAPSSRVPELIDLQPRPVALDYPYLLLAYLPGRPLDYATDLVAAARCVASVHRLEPPPDHRLQVHADPVRSILDETRRLLGVLPTSAGRWGRVRKLAMQVMQVEEMPAAAFDPVLGDLAIINTDLNSHNFIVNDERVWLIDWEKARIGPTLLDIAHFLLPTTTLWRDATAVRLGAAQRETFLSAYLDGRPGIDVNTYRAGLRAALQLAALRAVAWCAWAVVVSERGERAIQNEETLAKCRFFTSRQFLDELADELEVGAQ